VKAFIVRLLVLSFFVLSFWSTAFSQNIHQGTVEPAPEKDLLGLNSSNKSFSLLDPDRVKMWHSYTFSYFSGKGGSGNVGLYLNTIEYRPSDPLRLQVSLGYLHQPFSVIGDQSSGGKILPSFQLWYNPNSKIYLHINVSTTTLWYDQYLHDNYWMRRR